MPDAITSAVGTTPAATTAVKPAMSDAASSKDTFLKLLVAQLKYQNPMSPTDGTQFLQQTAQFTMVEKLEDLATKSDSILSAQQATEAATLIGRSIVAGGPGAKDVSGIVTGMRITADGPQLKIGNTEVALSALKEVTQDPTPTPTPSA